MSGYSYIINMSINSRVHRHRQPVAGTPYSREGFHPRRSRSKWPRS